MDRESAEGKLDQMPVWIPEYLACWGSKKPDGGRMTVTFAAEFAGTTPEAVRQYRKKSAAFRRLEEVARYAAAEWAQSYVEAGLRGMAPQVMRALAHLIEIERHPQTVIKAMEWLGARSTVAVEETIEHHFPDFDEALERAYGTGGGDGLQDNNG